MSSKKVAVGISSAPKKIAKIQFGTMPSSEMHKVSEVHISNRDLFKMPERTPASYGCLDPRLGISDKASTCKTCKYVNDNMF